MKKSLIIGLSAVSLLFMPMAKTIHAEQVATEAPPVAQALVREGDFALKLVEALKLGSANSEAEAESSLASVGIAPRNGWIASYPVTPDILSELRDAVGDAADGGRLAMNTDEALNAFHNLANETGLAVVSDTSDAGKGTEEPKSYGQYSDPTVINNYYYDEGPPVVTYYPPPWDYYYMYSWVPHPFWWHSFWFPGFFILHDFHKVVVVKHKVVKVVTNHVFDSGLKKVITVDPGTRTAGRVFGSGSGVSGGRRFDSLESRRGAASIVERSREKTRVGNTPAAVTDRGNPMLNNRSAGPGGRREGTALMNRGPGSETSSGPGAGSFSGTGTDRRLERGRNETGSRDRRDSLIDRSGNFGSRQGTNLNRFFEGRGGVSAPPPRTDGRGFSSSSGSGGRSFSSPGITGGRRGMSLDRSGPRMDRSFTGPSMRAPSMSGRGSPQGFRGVGGNNSGRGALGSSGSSRGGCRRRC